MIVIDTSVWLDLFLDDEKRRKIATKLIGLLSDEIFEPTVFKVEIAGVLSRKFKRKHVISFIDKISEKIEIVDEVDDIAFDVALSTGCRAIDAYFIAAAKYTDSILITNDKTMFNNAKKYGIESYYLIKDHKKIFRKLETFTRD